MRRVLAALSDPQGWRPAVKRLGITTIVLLVLVGYLAGFRIGLWLAGV